MTPGLRQHKHASLRIAIAEGLPEEMRDTTREILSVHSDDPRKGHATALLHEVCTEADKWWITLILCPRKFDDGMDDAKLIPFYERFGFALIQTEPAPLMVRSPEPPKIARIH